MACFFFSFSRTESRTTFSTLDFFFFFYMCTYVVFMKRFFSSVHTDKCWREKKACHCGEKSIQASCPPESDAGLRSF